MRLLLERKEMLGVISFAGKNSVFITNDENNNFSISVLGYRQDNETNQKIEIKFLNSRR